MIEKGRVARTKGRGKKRPILALSILPVLPALALLGHAPWRRRWLTGPLLARFREVLPRLSPSEQQALDAGTVGWDGALFSGRPDWSALLATPPARLTPVEQACLDGPVEALCALIDDWRVTHRDHDLSPQAGSDAGSTPDTGVVCHGTWRGETVLGLRLDWDKRYITLAPVATLIGLAFRCLDPNGLLGGTKDLGITVALVPRDTPGVEIGARHLPLDIPFMNGPIRGRDVFVPLTQVIGGTAGIGQGWRMLVESLAEGRGISLPALATGAAKVASRFTGAYAAVRRQFNQPIGRFEGVEEALARIAGLTYRMDAARALTLAFLDRGERPAVVSAIVKYHLTEGYRQVVNDAMDIQGGSGICLGPRNLLGRAYQAIPVAITVEGANILTRSMIIFGQGAIRCHPWVIAELAAAHDPDQTIGVRRFERLVLAHALHLLRNAAASLVLGLSRGRLGGRLARAPHSRARRYYQTLSWMSAALAVSADAAMMTLGGSLKRREQTRERLTAGVFIDPDESSPTRQLERALAAAAALAPIEANLGAWRKTGRLRAHDLPGLCDEAFGQGLIGEEERHTVRTYLEILESVVRVDAFPDFAAGAPGLAAPAAVNATSAARARIAAGRRSARHRCALAT